MIISYQLSTQQRHETVRFYDSIYRLILVSCRGYFVDFCQVMHIFLFWIVILRIYIIYGQKKVSISMYYSIVEKYGFNQNIEIEKSTVCVCVCVCVFCVCV